MIEYEYHREIKSLRWDEAECRCLIMSPCPPRISIPKRSEMNGILRTTKGQASTDVKWCSLSLSDIQDINIEGQFQPPIANHEIRLDTSRWGVTLHLAGSRHRMDIAAKKAWATWSLTLGTDQALDSR